MSYTYATWTCTPYDEHTWDWEAGVVHVCSPGPKAPTTLCGREVRYTKVTKHGTAARFQWANCKVHKAVLCPVCEKLLKEPGYSLDAVGPMTRIPNWNEGGH
jgi:hypothetical protein